MMVKTVKTQGLLNQNCYILENKDSSLIIDPGSEYEKIKKEITKTPVGILITHRHYDHIGVLQDLVNEYKVPVYEKANLEEKNYQVASFSFDVIFTPGHSIDSVTYYFKEDKIMFTGDFLFKGTIGRCDLEGGSFPTMQESIEKIKEYPSDITIYPGHDDKTTIGFEKETNPYFK